MPPGVYAAIFDLDGVLTSTSARHEQSWAEAAHAFGIPVSDAALRATRSIPRASALDAILRHAGATLAPDAREKVMALKNARYRELIENLTPADAFPGARACLETCRALGLRTAVASASLNAPLVLARIGLASLVDFVAPAASAAAKPDPEIYHLAAAALGALPATTICIEDGAPMIANLAAFHTVGIGPEPLGADEHAPTIADWDVSATLATLKARD